MSAAATATLSDSVPPGIGMRTAILASPASRGERPCPSLPMRRSTVGRIGLRAEARHPPVADDERFHGVICRSAFAPDQILGRPALLPCAPEDLLSLRDEQPGLLPVLLLLQRADELDRRVLDGRDNP